MSGNRLSCVRLRQILGAHQEKPRSTRSRSILWARSWMASSSPASPALTGLARPTFCVPHRGRRPALEKRFSRPTMSAPQRVGDSAKSAPLGALLFCLSRKNGAGRLDDPREPRSFSRERASPSLRSEEPPTSLQRRNCIRRVNKRLTAGGSPTILPANKGSAGGEASPTGGYLRSWQGLSLVVNASSVSSLGLKPVILRIARAPLTLSNLIRPPLASGRKVP